MEKRNKKLENEIKTLENYIDVIKNTECKLLSDEQINDIVGITARREVLEAENEYKEALKNKKDLKKVKNLKIRKKAAIMVLPLAIVIAGNFACQTILLKTDIFNKEYQYVSTITTNTGETFIENSYQKLSDYTLTVMENIPEQNKTKVYILDSNSNGIKEENKEEILKASSYEELVEKELIPTATPKITYLENNNGLEKTYISLSENVKNKKDYILKKSYEEKKKDLPFNIFFPSMLGLLTFIGYELINKSRYENNIIDGFKELITLNKEKSNEISNLKIKEKKANYKSKKKELKNRGK